MLLKTLNIEVDFLKWIPLVSFSSATFISAIGIQSLTITVVSEIRPERIKETYMSFSISILLVFNFVSTKYLPSFTDFVGFAGSMYAFAGVCLLSALYIIFYVPETKGKSYDEIVKALAPKSNQQP